MKLIAKSINYGGKTMTTLFLIAIGTVILLLAKSKPAYAVWQCGWFWLRASELSGSEGQKLRATLRQADSDLLLGLANISLGMADVEKEDHENAVSANLTNSEPYFSKAVTHLESSLSTVLSLRDSAPSTLQQEIAVTSFYVENLINSVKDIATTLASGKYPSARQCAESTSALREIYSVMTRNALSKR